MKSLLLHESDGLRTFVLVLETDDEVTTTLLEYARRERLGGSHFTAIGACSEAVVAYFDWGTKTYQPVRIAEQVEVLSMVGDITEGQDGPKVHAHVVLAKRDASAHGGHLVSALVRPTLEIVLTESPRHLRRRLDPESGFALISGVSKER